MSRHPRWQCRTEDGKEGWLQKTARLRWPAAQTSATRTRQCMQPAVQGERHGPGCEQGSSFSPVRVHVKHYKRQTVPTASGPRSYTDIGNGGVLDCWHDSVYTFAKLCNFVRTGLQRAASLLFQQYQSTYSPLENHRLQNCGVDHPHFVSGRRGRRCSCKAKFACQLITGCEQGVGQIQRPEGSSAHQPQCPARPASSGDRK